MRIEYSSEVVPKTIRVARSAREGILENMDEQQTQNINQAMEQLADSAQQSFQMLADRTVRVHRRETWGSHRTSSRTG